MSDVAGGEGNRQDRDGETHPPPAFDRDAWLAELDALNPWAVPFYEKIDELRSQGRWDGDKPPPQWNAETSDLQSAIVQARRQACLARWSQHDDSVGDAKQRWNAWAEGMLALRDRLPASGRGRKSRSSLWKSEMRRIGFLSWADFSGLCLPGGADFAGFIFPGPVDFGETTFGHALASPGKTSFKEASFAGGPAIFETARFDSGPVSFWHALFGGGEARFDNAEFSGGNAEFSLAFFSGGAASFQRAVFSGGNALFVITIFNGGKASFREAVFSGGSASFDHAQFSGGDADFTDVEFLLGAAVFKGTQFTGGSTTFRGAEFVGEATSFETATFGGRASFSDTLIGSADAATAQGVALFKTVKFADRVSFNRSRMSVPISFDASRFRDEADFSACESLVGFSLADCAFEQVPNLVDAAFHQPPRLDNLHVRDPVARYEPFEGDPRPHDSKWAQLFGVTRMALARDANDEARFRVLRKLAIDAQDYERELEFHAQEIRCRRFWRDRPWGRWVYIVDEELPGKYPHTFVPRIRHVDRTEYTQFSPGDEHDREKPDKIALRRVDKRRRAAGAARFWFGWAYGGVSNFGRSMITPASIWAVLVVLFALLFLAVRQPPAGAGAETATAERLFKCDAGAPGSRDGEVSRPPWISICQGLERSLRSTRDAGRSVFEALGGVLQNNRCIAGRGISPVQEAFALSFKNALVLIDWDRSEAARRTFGCLYGYDFDNLEGDKPDARGTSYPHVPFSVSVLSILQNLLSAILIFLFLLALRNLLKLK